MSDELIIVRAHMKPGESDEHYLSRMRRFERGPAAVFMGPGYWDSEDACLRAVVECSTLSDDQETQITATMAKYVVVLDPQSCVLGNNFCVMPPAACIERRMAHNRALAEAARA